MNSSAGAQVKFGKHRPLRSGSYSAIVTRQPEDVLADLEKVSQMIASQNFSSTLVHAIGTLHFNLKLMGPEMEHLYKDVLDKRFVQLRDGCRDARLARAARVRLLELIELRANYMPWTFDQAAAQYYRYALTSPSSVGVSGGGRRVMFACSAGVNDGTTGTGPDDTDIMSATTRACNHLGRVARSHSSSRVRDEVVIRNADSGKVMGVKGLRVHKIEQLSGTVISFQRVPHGSKDRLVHITGPDENSVLTAHQLIQDVIRRNASPTRAITAAPAPGDLPAGSPLAVSSPCVTSPPAGSDDSVSSVHSDEWRRDGTGTGTGVGVGVSRSVLGQFRYTVSVAGRSVKLTGTHANLVKTAKLVLDEYFSAAPCDRVFGDRVDLESIMPVVGLSQVTPAVAASTVVSSSAAVLEQGEVGAGDCRHVNTASTAGASSTRPVSRQRSEQQTGTTSCTTLTRHSPAPHCKVLHVNADSEAGVMCGDNGAARRQYDRATLLLYSKAAVTRYPPAGWRQLHQQLPGVVRLSPTPFNLGSYMSRVLEGSDDMHETTLTATTTTHNNNNNKH